MTTQESLTIRLAQMPSVAELFRLFLSGKHLNRMAEPALWVELEQEEASYRTLFAALGFDLRLDARGFAWFHAGDASSTIGKTSRQLALLFMLIFDAQANAGKALQRFSDWRIESDWLLEVHKQQQELLDAEGLDFEALIELLGRACNLGFALAEPAGWRLLPAVSRYLDHFEGLAQMVKQDLDEDHDEEGMPVDILDDEENA